MKPFLLVFVLSIVIIFSKDLNAQCEGVTPTASNILNHGVTGEFGIYSPQTPFTVQVEGDIQHTSLQRLKEDGTVQYYYYPYNTTESPGSTFPIPNDTWTKVTVNGSNVFYVRLPTRSEVGNLDPDFVVSQFGGKYDKVPCNYSWNSVLSHDDPTLPLSVGINGPLTVEWKTTGNWTANVTGGFGTVSYQWKWRNNDPDNGIYPNDWSTYSVSSTSSSFSHYQSIPEIDIQLKILKGIQSDSTEIHITRTGYGGPLLKGKNKSSVIPQTNMLYPNYPNPFNPSTQIKYDIKEAGFVSLKVYDSLGKEVAALVDGNRAAGSYSVNFNASKLSSGIYLYKLVTGNYVKSEKMILMK